MKRQKNVASPYVSLQFQYGGKIPHIKFDDATNAGLVGNGKKLTDLLQKFIVIDQMKFDGYFTLTLKNGIVSILTSKKLPRNIVNVLEEAKETLEQMAKIDSYLFVNISINHQHTT